MGNPLLYLTRWQAKQGNEQLNDESEKYRFHFLIVNDNEYLAVDFIILKYLSKNDVSASNLHVMNLTITVTVGKFQKIILTGCKRTAISLISLYLIHKSSYLPCLKTSGV